MKKLLIFISVCFVACTDTPKKPFVITGKYLGDGWSTDMNTTARYYYVDGNGNTSQFTELPTKYSIGDTIK